MQFCRGDACVARFRNKERATQASPLQGTEMKLTRRTLLAVALGLLSFSTAFAADKAIGVGAKPPAGADVLIDGTRKTLDEKWTYWQGPGFKSSMPIKRQIVEDPGDRGTGPLSDDPPP